MNQRHRRAAARKSQTASGAGLANSAALYEAGLGHMRAGRYLDAQICCQQAIALDSAHADTLHLMGLLSLHAKQHDQAVEWISRAIRRDPKPAYLTSLGTTLLDQGRQEEALQVFDKAVQLKPDDADLWRDLGNVLVEAGRSGDAILTFQQAIKLNPRHWEAANRVAFLLYSAQRFEESVACFTVCDGLQPDHFSTVYMRALALQKLKRFDEALTDNMRAHDLDPTSADNCNNAGNVLRALGRNEEAISWFDLSLKLRPDFADTLTNRAVALAELRRFDEAITTYHRALAIDPSHTIAAWNLVGLQLATGNFKAGWAGREVRWKLPSLSPGYPKLARPMWLGAEPIAGKTLLVISDEGLGDAIQFARYIPMLAAGCARCPDRTGCAAWFAGRIDRRLAILADIDGFGFANLRLPLLYLQFAPGLRHRGSIRFRPRYPTFPRRLLTAYRDGNNASARMPGYGSALSGRGIRITQTTMTARCRCGCYCRS
jgi:tetratricopeptide (TPR) repeat protein